MWCSIYSAGIIVSLVIYGILQERIMTQPYNGQTFSSSVFLVLCNRLAAVGFALIFATIRGESLVNQAPLWKYAVVSLSNVFASACQYESLKYVSFAVQMLGKSFKMMPVMVWGMLISGKSYGPTDWCIALSVTCGISLFLTSGSIQSPNGNANSAYGFVLLMAFLFLDGLTSTFQEKLFKEHKTTKYNQMLYINMLSALTSVGTLTVTNTLISSISFAAAHPLFVWDASTLSASAVMGQYFIYSQVKEFGALVLAATMNVRQLLSIMVSSVTYDHQMTMLQNLGLALVFMALFFKSAAGIFESATDSECKRLIQDPKVVEKAPEDSKVDTKV